LHELSDVGCEGFLSDTVASYLPPQHLRTEKAQSAHSQQFAASYAAAKRIHRAPIQGMSLSKSVLLAGGPCCKQQGGMPGNTRLRVQQLRPEIQSCMQRDMQSPHLLFLNTVAAFADVKPLQIGLFYFRFEEDTTDATGPKSGNIPL
jgi:hypothetical protein